MGKTNLKPGKVAGEDVAARYYQELDRIKKRLSSIKARETVITKERDRLWEEKDRLQDHRKSLQADAAKLFEIPADQKGKG